MSTTFYISIASSVAFVISEILPFINDTKVNGILHSIKIFLDDCKKNQVSDAGNIENFKNEFDTKTKETDNFIVTIKTDIDSIKTDVNGIKTDVDNIKNNNSSLSIENDDGVIVNIKTEIFDIKNDVNYIKSNINDIKNMFEHSEIV
jgi:trimeric autotransporter adhesin